VIQTGAGAQNRTGNKELFGGTHFLEEIGGEGQGEEVFHPTWSILNKDVAVEYLVGGTPTSATGTVALPKTEQHTATFLFKML
jgi:hypothetical protein